MQKILTYLCNIIKDKIYAIYLIVIHVREMNVNLFVTNKENMEIKKYATADMCNTQI